MVLEARENEVSGESESSKILQYEKKVSIMIQIVSYRFNLSGYYAWRIKENNASLT